MPDTGGMDDRMIIDAASPADAEALACIHLAARHAAMPWLPVLYPPESVPLYFRNRVLASEKVLIARDEGQARGFISVKGGWLTHLYVAPPHWGKGVGARLLETARSDLSALQLWVFEGNTRARRFYSQRGFRDCAFTDGQRNEEKMPDVRMVWVRRVQAAPRF